MRCIAHLLLVLGVCTLHSQTRGDTDFVPPLLNAEERLAKNVVETSLYLTRPVPNQGEPLQVRFGVAVTQVDVDEELKLMRATLWLRHVSEIHRGIGNEVRRLVLKHTYESSKLESIYLSFNISCFFFSFGNYISTNKSNKKVYDTQMT